MMKLIGVLCFLMLGSSIFSHDTFASSIAYAPQSDSYKPYKPKLVPPIKKTIKQGDLTCAVDAEALKCWLTWGRFYPNLEKLIVRPGVSDFLLDRNGIACWFNASILECASGRYRVGTNASEGYDQKWPELGSVKSIRFPYLDIQSRENVLCTEDRYQGKNRKICGRIDSYTQDVRYEDDQFNDGEPLPDVCSVDLQYSATRGVWDGDNPKTINYTAEIRRAFLDLGFKIDKSSQIKIEGFNDTRQSRYWDRYGNVQYEEHCDGKLAISYPGFNFLSARKCPGIGEAFATLPQVDCKSSRRLKLSPIKKQLDFGEFDSIDRDDRDAFALLKTELLMQEPRLSVGQRYSSLQFKSPSGEAIELDLSGTNQLSLFLASYANFHVYFNYQKKSYQFFDRAWKKMNVKIEDGTAARNFHFDGGTYTCIGLSCYRLE